MKKMTKRALNYADKSSAVRNRRFLDRKCSIGLRSGAIQFDGISVHTLDSRYDNRYGPQNRPKWTQMEDPYADFAGHYPTYAGTAALDRLRTTEYRRLDELGQVSLD